MLGIGGGEMVALAILALLVFGPEGLPEIMKTVARTIRAFKSAANDFQSEVNTALALETQKSEVQQRRRRRSLPAPEVTEQAKLPAPAEDMTSENTDDSSVAPPSLSDSEPDSTPLEKKPTTDLQPEGVIPEDDTVANLVDKNDALTDLGAPSAASVEAPVADDDDDEFGPRRPMARPDRSAEAVIADDEDETDFGDEEEQEVPTTSKAEVEA